MWTFPDARLLSENQRRALSRLAYNAFLDMRILGREGKSRQVADLAEAFHNLPLMLWSEEFSMKCQRDFLQRYQEKHGVHHPSFNYLAEFEKIAAMTE